MLTGRKPDLGVPGRGTFGFVTDGAGAGAFALVGAGLGDFVSLFMRQRYGSPMIRETWIAGVLCQCTFVADLV
jgi:hypothetical protein